MQTFVAAASELNFTRAATVLHTVQSAVSATIRSLESEIETSLFDRTLRQIRLTPAGEALLPEARAVLDSVRAARDAVDATTTAVTGQVALGYMTSVSLVDIPAVLSGFTRRHTQVEVSLKAAEQGTAGLIDMLRGGELDLALIMHHETLPDLEATPVGRSPIRLTVPIDHPLAEKEKVGLDRLSEEQFVDFPSGFGFRELADSMFGASDITRNVAFESMDILSVAALVDHGLGISFLPEFASDSLPHVTTVPLDQEFPDMVVSVATAKRRPLSAAGRALRAAILTGGSE